MTTEYKGDDDVVLPSVSHAITALLEKHQRLSSTLSCTVLLLELLLRQMVQLQYDYEPVAVCKLLLSACVTGTIVLQEALARKVRY